MKFEEFLPPKPPEEHITLEQIKEVAKRTIGAYKVFLSADYELPELEKRAISKIYQLTEEIDLVEGYEEFLRHYSSAPEAKDAGERIHEIAYAVARTEHTVSAYTGFLLNFPAAPQDLQDAAFFESVSLEEEEIERELAGYEFESELVRQNTIERIGRRLYEEAIAAKDTGDVVKFRRNTTLPL